MREPDWYVDPNDPTNYRYWDGDIWTSQVSPRWVEPVATARTNWGTASLLAAIVGMGLVLLSMVGGFSCDAADDCRGIFAIFFGGLGLEVIALSSGLIGRRVNPNASSDPKVKSGVRISAWVLVCLGLWMAFVWSATS